MVVITHLKYLHIIYVTGKNAIICFNPVGVPTCVQMIGFCFQYLCIGIKRNPYPCSIFIYIEVISIYICVLTTAQPNSKQRRISRRNKWFEKLNLCFHSIVGGFWLIRCYQELNVLVVSITDEYPIAIYTPL